jgi:cell wall assembly regulator SMI1
MKELLNRLDKWLAKHRKKFHKNLNRGATPVELEQLGKKLAKPAPAGLAELLAWHNGQGEDYAGYFEGHWLLMDAGRIAAVKEELDASAGEYGWKKEWLPFLDDDGGNYLVLDTSQKEPPVVVFLMGEKSEQLAPSLEAWMTDFVTAVEAGKYYEEPERGTFKRQ